MTHVCIYVCMYVCMYVCKCTYIYVCTYVGIYVCMHIYVRLKVYRVNFLDWNNLIHINAHDMQYSKHVIRL